MLVFTRFFKFKKMWKVRNTVNTCVLATFGRRNAGIYAIFCPQRRQTLVNYNIFLIVFLILMKATHGGIYAFYKKLNPVNKNVLATFED